MMPYTKAEHGGCSHDTEVEWSRNHDCLIPDSPTDIPAKNREATFCPLILVAMGKTWYKIAGKWVDVTEAYKGHHTPEELYKILHPGG